MTTNYKWFENSDGMRVQLIVSDAGKITAARFGVALPLSAEELEIVQEALDTGELVATT